MSPTGYAIFFENEPTATAAADQVVVTNQIDPTRFDLTTLTLGPISFLGFPGVVPTAIPLQTLGQFSTQVSLETTNLLVNVKASLNSTTGLLTWTLQAIDPITGLPPADPSLGLLPPGGGGSVSFTARLVPTLALGALIADQAVVTFDANAPISTAVWSNTLDNTPPASHVNALPPTESTSSFIVNWSGTDGGSGVQSYTIYVSDSGGQYGNWLTQTSSTSAKFIGNIGHTYSFYSIATDNAGNVEAAKTSSDTSTQIVPPATTTSLQASAAMAFPGQSVTLTAAVAGPTGNGATPTGTVTFLSGTTTLGTTTLNSSGVASFASALPLGTDSVTAQYSGDANFASSTSSTVSIVVAKIMTTTLVASSATPANLNAIVTLTATVTPALGSGAPTGTVTFSDGTTALGMGALGSSGSGSYSTANLTAGVHTITAVYSGDGNYLGSTSSTFTQTVNAPGYSLSVTPTTVTIAGGQSGQATFTVTPVGGFKSQISFACSGLPPYATCTFSPSSVTPDGTNTAVTSTLTIATNVKTASVKSPAKPGDHPYQYNEKLLALALFGLPSLLWGRRKVGKRWSALHLIVVYGLLSLAATMMQGCGGGTNMTTPRGTDTITVTATGGGAAQTASVTLTVQ